jgi:signal transduction histidine kinase/ActR/RegA family two-component response regulator
MTAHLSLRWKLTAVIAAGGVAVAIIAAGGFCALDLHRSSRRTVQAIQSLGGIVAEQVPPAVALNDPRAASDTLAALRNGDTVRDAVLYDAAGLCFATFHRVPVRACPARLPDGVAARPGVVIVTLPVLSDRERVGTLMLVAGLPSAASVLRQFVGGAAFIILLSCLIAVGVGMLLQARIASPILDIARVAQRISQTHGYQERVTEVCCGELHVLARSFNTMLDEIARRDSQLAHQQRDLEEQVAERNVVNAELRLAKERAEEAARLKTEFLANMSHEIRTPMNGVMGMISLVLDQLADPAQREQLQVAHCAARSLVTILNDILDLSKIEAGKLTIESLDFDLRSTVREAVRMFEIAARDKRLELSATIHAGCPAWVRGDATRLRQILVNLVGNAVKFTPRGAVRVSVRPAQPGRISFQVSDTGIGVPPDKLNTIFEPFTQADGSHTRQFGGTGLGLTITRRLAELMGGSVRAESQISRGSTFTADLPLAEVAKPAAFDRPAAQSVPAVPLQVLVAEDNLVNQKVVEAMLSRQGHTVTLANNGEEAFRHFLAARFDLVLMDIQMPEADGLQAARWIREEEKRREEELHRGSSDRLPILALTAHASLAQRDQCVAAGMDGVLTKPIDLATLAAAIAQYSR